MNADPVALEWAAYERDNAAANVEYDTQRPTGCGEQSGEWQNCAKCGAEFEHNTMGRRRKYCRHCSPVKEPL